MIARHERVGFGGPSSQSARWYGGFAPEITHFLKAPQGDILASVGLLHDAHGGGLWCGGRPLSGLSYTSLVVEPAARGRGVATSLNEAIVREAARRKLAVASLYPASLELYRKVGFELMGNLELLGANPEVIRPVSESKSVHVRPGGPEHRDAMILLRDELLAQRGATGAYQRDALSWKMLFQTTNEDPAETLLFYRGDDLVGYMILDMLAGKPVPLERQIWIRIGWQQISSALCDDQGDCGFGTVHKSVTWHPQASEDLAEAMSPQATYILPKSVSRWRPVSSTLIRPWPDVGIAAL